MQQCEIVNQPAINVDEFRAFGWNRYTRWRQASCQPGIAWLAVDATERNGDGLFGDLTFFQERRFNYRCVGSWIITRRARFLAADLPAQTAWTDDFFGRE